MLFEPLESRTLYNAISPSFGGLPSPLVPGQSLSTSVSLSNRSEVFARYSVTVYLSNSPTFSSDAVLISNAPATGGLSPDMSTTVYLSLTIPASVTPGIYYPKVIVSDSSSSPGSDTGGPVSVLAPTIDLAISSLDFTASSAPGQLMQITPTLAPTPTPQSDLSIRYYLSTDAVLTSGTDFFLGQATYPSSTSLLPRSFRVPQGVPVGAYRVLAVVDPENHVAESDEINNLFAGPTVVLSPGSSLPQPTGSTALTVAAGKLAPAAVTLANPTGARMVGKFSVTFYLSDDAALSDDDVPVTTRQVAAALRPNQTASRALRVKVPTNAAPGPRYLLSRSTAPGSDQATWSATLITVTAPHIAAELVSAVPRARNTLVTLRLTNTGTAASSGAVTLVLSSEGSEILAIKRSARLRPGRAVLLRLTLPNPIPDPSTLTISVN